VNGQKPGTRFAPCCKKAQARMWHTASVWPRTSLYGAWHATAGCTRPIQVFAHRLRLTERRKAGGSGLLDLQAPLWRSAADAIALVTRKGTEPSDPHTAKSHTTRPKYFAESSRFHDWDLTCVVRHAPEGKYAANVALWLRMLVFLQNTCRRRHFNQRFVTAYHGSPPSHGAEG